MDCFSRTFSGQVQEESAAAATHSLSSVALVEYRLDGGSWVQGNSLTVLADDDQDLGSRAIDFAGNVTVRAIVVRIDAIPPMPSKA